MKTALNLEPPSFGGPEVAADPMESALQTGADVLVDVSGVIYPGKVSRTTSKIPNEVSVETPAAVFMSRHWKVLLFYIDTRKAVYGSARLILPGIDPVPTQTQVQHEIPKPEETKAPLDEPQALSRDEDVGDQWTEASTLNEEEQEELWYNRD